MRLIISSRIKIKLISILILILLLAFVASKHFSLHKKPLSTENPQSKAWLQPISLNDQYPNLISKASWSFSFTQIEKIINNLKQDPSKNLIINSDLTEKLNQVLFHLDTPPASNQWQRLEFLFIKSLGENTGREFHQLLSNYYHYQKESVAYSDRIKQAKYNEKRNLIASSTEVLKEMQIRHFTKDNAIKLFGKKNKISHYLNAIRTINMDKSLSNSQKKQRLSKLSEDYKNSLSQR